jgi:hypothetical protein
MTKRALAPFISKVGRVYTGAEAEDTQTDNQSSGRW